MPPVLTPMTKVSTRRYVVSYRTFTNPRELLTREFKSSRGQQDFVDRHRAIQAQQSKRLARKGKTLKRRSAWVWFEQRVI